MIPGRRPSRFAPVDDVLVLLEDQRPRADERHLAPDDVDQLRELVDPRAPEEAAETRYTRVVRDLEHPRVVVAVHVEMGDLRLPLLRVDHHRAELVDAERPVAGAHPYLPEEHRPGRVDLDPQRDDEEQGRQEHEAAPRRR